MRETLRDWLDVAIVSAMLIGVVSGLIALWVLPVLALVALVSWLLG